ncbi:subtilisin-like serine protease, putative [Bodo saltans]|uniref:Subtilisin-like serine protease, putative n=1 Tax=Bodo saltans TaxID=75058 RepID=A0A0S4IUS2_BODSA|nr:subtilisin-like serine protease, putative [Bodo saltans]|eukprot:CUF99314.1 subtilisin-like serine protease, putative [Bodo saltans]
MTTCSCKGAWSGSACSVCNGPNGSTCLADGTIKACDGFTYSSSAGAPAVDKCGVCGGSGNCIGCDGIPNSGKVYDSCGVCGGDNGCLGTTSASPVSVTFLVDVHSYITLQTYQYQSLAAYCKKLQDMAAQGVIIDTVSCVISDYITWQTQGAGYTSTNTTQLDIHRLYTYAYGAGRIGDLIFSDTNGNSSTLQLLYVVNTVNLPILTVAPNARIFDLYESMLAIAGQLEGQLRDSGLSDASVRQTSTSWANAVAAEVSLATLKFTAGIGIAMAFCIMGSFFANFRLSLFATMSVVFVFCGTLAVAYTQGWDIDAVTQICVAGVIAVAVEHLVHIVDGYQDFLQSTQTHMFALSTTCMHAFRGSLTRTGVSIISSTIATVAVALLFVVSAIQPFRRAAQVMITVHIFTLITAVLFGAALCAFGPTVLIRHWAATTVLCCTCAVCGAIALLIIYLAGGVAGPSGYSVP